MTRSSIFMLIIIGSAATALAAVAPDVPRGFPEAPRNVTVVEKNQAFPLVGPFVVEECIDTSCTMLRG